MEDSTQCITIVSNIVVSENDFVEHSNIKVENDNQSKIVFGQSEGGSASDHLLCERVADAGFFKGSKYFKVGD